MPVGNIAGFHSDKIIADEFRTVAGANAFESSVCDADLERFASAGECAHQAFRSIKNFFSREPGEGAYNGTLMMFGDNFINGVTIADLDALVTEAGERQAQAVMRVSPNIEVMADVPELLDQHDQLIALYNVVSNQRVEREEQTQ